MLMLLEEFMSVMDEEMENLTKSVADEDGEMIKHVAHKMKGAAANMMVEDLRSYCHEMQDADKSDNALVDSLLEKIKSSYSEFKSLF